MDEQQVQVVAHPADREVRWSPNTKLLASLLFLVALAWMFWRFSALIQPLVLAVILAYLLHPAITAIARHTFLNRAAAAVLVLAGLLVVGFTIAFWLIAESIRQANLLYNALPSILERLQASLQSLLAQAAGTVESLMQRPGFGFVEQLWLQWLEPISPDGSQLEWNLGAIGDQALQWFNPLLQQGLITASGFAKGTFNVLAVTLLVLILSLYIIIDIPKVGSYIDGLAPVRSIQQDLQALWRRFSEIWKAYLRGQILISLLLFAVYTVLLPVLRVNNAFGLALAAGALEFLPVIGPVASSVLIILVALFQDTTAFGLATVQYGLLVALCVVAVQQVESNIIVPRIIGNSLRLHPVVVLLSVLMGTSLAGVLGAVLAAPVMASAKLVVTYAWYRVLDQPLTFLEEGAQEETKPKRRWPAWPGPRRRPRDTPRDAGDEEPAAPEPDTPEEATK